MKKLITILITLSILSTLCSCNSSENKAKETSDNNSSSVTENTKEAQTQTENSKPTESEETKKQKESAKELEKNISSIYHKSFSIYTDFMLKRQEIIDKAADDYKTTYEPTDDEINTAINNMKSIDTLSKDSVSKINSLLHELDSYKTEQSSSLAKEVKNAVNDIGDYIIDWNTAFQAMDASAAESLDIPCFTKITTSMQIIAVEIKEFLLDSGLSENEITAHIGSSDHPFKNFMIDLQNFSNSFGNLE